MSGSPPTEVDRVARRLAAAGCVAPLEEAQDLCLAAAGDSRRLAEMVDRRTTGEPLGWITGQVTFCGCSIEMAPGVYVPRWQSEPLAEAAIRRLPAAGRAVDLGTGSGVIARTLLTRRPGASVVATERDPVAARCARRNGVVVVGADLFEGVPATWRRKVDVVVGVLPYVPTGQLAYLPPDVTTFEPRSALHGGADGLAEIRRAVAGSRHWLRPGGSLLLELGGEQAELIAPILAVAGLGRPEVLVDEDGDVRGVEARASR